MRLNPRLEIVRFDNRPNREGYRVVQVAVDGRLAWPFDLHETDYAEMSEPEFHAYLINVGETLLRHYGDARSVRMREDGQCVPLTDTAA